MQVKTIRYSRLVNLGNFENETYEMTADILYDEDENEAIAALKGKIDAAVKAHSSIFQQPIAPEPEEEVIVGDYDNVPIESAPLVNQIDDDEFTQQAIDGEPAPGNIIIHLTAEEMNADTINVGKENVGKESKPDQGTAKEEPEPDEEPLPKLEDIVAAHGIKKASEIEAPSEEEIKDKLAEAEKRQRDREKPTCETCGGSGTVEDPDSADPLDTMMCPDC